MEAEPVAHARLDDEELARIVRIVRTTLEDGRAKKEQKPPAPLWRRAAPFCLKHWALMAFAASVLLLIGPPSVTEPRRSTGSSRSPSKTPSSTAKCKIEYEQTVVDRQVRLGNELLDVWKLEDAASFQGEHVQGSCFRRLRPGTGRTATPETHS